VEEKLLRELMDLYSSAIEYFGYIDQSQKCFDLQKRMQSILVRDYILDSLTRFEEERVAREEGHKRRQTITTVVDTKAEKNQEVIAYNSSSSDEDDFKEVNFECSSENSADSDVEVLEVIYDDNGETLDMTPRGVKVVDMRIWWESAPIEQPEYTARKV